MISSRGRRPGLWVRPLSAATAESALRRQWLETKGRAGHPRIRPPCRQRCGFGGGWPDPSGVRMELLTWKVHSVHQPSDNSDSPNGIPTFCACITTPQMGLFTLLRGAKSTGALKILQHSARCTQRDVGVRTDVLRRTNEG